MISSAPSHTAAPNGAPHGVAIAAGKTSASARLTTTFRKASQENQYRTASGCRRRQTHESAASYARVFVAARMFSWRATAVSF